MVQTIQRAIVDGSQELSELAMLGLVEADVCERQHAEPQLFSVQKRCVAGNDTVSLQVTNSAPALRRRQMHALRELNIGESAVILKAAQDAKVDLV